ncbi:MAG TPA: hypothetical protein VFV32_01725 [Acidimicrobiales bacterium]|nr:hypothetical protein [Acidimicrobiales bacterium]
MADEGTEPTSGDLTLEPPTGPRRDARRRVLWGALAVVAVAAGALVVVSAGGDDGPPTLPVSLAGGRHEAAGAMVADMALAYVRYEAGDELPALGGEAPAHRLRPTVDEASVRALANALALDGDVVHDGELWHVTDGEKTLEVHGPTGSWWFSTAKGGVATASGSASRGGASGGSAGCDPGPAVDCVSPETTIPQPPADLPSKDDARRVALDLLRATGADVDGAEVNLDGPYDAWYVDVRYAVDGVTASGWGSMVAVGSKGAIVNASGLLVDIERLGDYPLLDTRAAIDRLNTQQGAMFDGGPAPASGSGGTEPGVAVPETAVADAPVAVVTPATSPCNPDAAPDDATVCTSIDPDGPITTIVCADAGGSSEPGTAPGDKPAIAIAECPPLPMSTEPVEPMPAPEPMEIVLTTAEPALVMLSASDGSTDLYLVPGYRLGNADGTQVEVAAVADEALAPTTTIEPPGSTRPPEPAPAPSDCDVLVEDDGSGTTPTVQTCRTTTTIGGSEPRPLEAGESPSLGVPYRVGLILHCVNLVDWDGRWWGTDAVNAPPGWTGSGTFTLTSEDQGTYVDDGAPDAPAPFTAQGTDYPGCD